MYLQEEGWRKERNISKKDVGWLLQQKIFRAQITRNVQQTEQRIFPKPQRCLASSHCHGLDQNQGNENKEHDRQLKNLLV